jgi:hypothetical protein
MLFTVLGIYTADYTGEDFTDSGVGCTDDCLEIVEEN